MLIFACLALGLGMLQIRTTIFGPFIDPLTKQAQAVDQAQVLFNETVRLQSIDTDQDGLNDFEEVNFYQTSPYLPDSDSDGLSDKKEIDDGTDPLCPEGKDCGLGVSGAFETTVTDDVDITSPVYDQALSDTGAILGDETGTSTPSLFNIGAMLQDPAQLRAALLASGQIDAQQLSTLTDDQLLDLGQQALRSQASGSVPPPSNLQNASADVTSEQLQALLDKPDELRALLISTGKMTKEQLDQVDDATLISATKELISSSQ